MNTLMSTLPRTLTIAESVRIFSHFRDFLLFFFILGLAHLIKPKAIVSASPATLNGYLFEDLGVPEALSYRPGTAQDLLALIKKSGKHLYIVPDSSQIPINIDKHASSSAPYMSSLNVHSLIDRAWNVYASYALRGLTFSLRRNMNAFFKERFGDDYPSIEVSIANLLNIIKNGRKNDLVSLQSQAGNAALIIVNGEPLIDYAAPTLTKVIDVGGIGAKPAKPLDEVINRPLFIYKCRFSVLYKVSS